MSAAILRVAKSSTAVEHGFLAAGITIAAVCVVQSIVIMLGWLF